MKQKFRTFEIYVVYLRNPTGREGIRLSHFNEKHAGDKIVSVQDPEIRRFEPKNPQNKLSPLRRAGLESTSRMSKHPQFVLTVAPSFPLSPGGPIGPGEP